MVRPQAALHKRGACDPPGLEQGPNLTSTWGRTPWRHDVTLARVPPSVAISRRKLPQPVRVCMVLLEPQHKERRCSLHASSSSLYRNSPPKTWTPRDLRVMRWVSVVYGGPPWLSRAILVPAGAPGFAQIAPRFAPRPAKRRRGAQQSRRPHTSVIVGSHIGGCSCPFGRGLVNHPEEVRPAGGRWRTVRRRGTAVERVESILLA
jgi:hypothetical protein